MELYDTVIRADQSEINVSVYDDIVGSQDIQSPFRQIGAKTKAHIQIKDKLKTQRQLEHNRYNMLLNRASEQLRNDSKRGKRDLLTAFHSAQGYQGIKNATQSSESIELPGIAKNPSIRNLLRSLNGS